jgi:hypothetical protein
MNDAILYVLAAPLPGTRTPAYLMHQVGGVDCVLAYTDLDRLVESCGENQPWLGVRIDALMADLRDQRLPGPVVNLPLVPAARWTAGGPPWDQSRLGEVGEVGEVGPAPGASEFGGWDDEACESDEAVAVDSTAGGTAAGAAPPGRRQEWWR